MEKKIKEEEKPQCTKMQNEGIQTIADDDQSLSIIAQRKNDDIEWTDKMCEQRPIGNPMVPSQAFDSFSRQIRIFLNQQIELRNQKVQLLDQQEKLLAERIGELNQQLKSLLHIPIVNEHEKNLNEILQEIKQQGCSLK